MKRIFVILLPLALMAQTDSNQEQRVTANSAEFERSAQTSMMGLEEKGFDLTLLSPSLGSLPKQEFEAARARVVAGAVLATELGNPTSTYDVILQPGHYARKSGATGTQGVLISEQQIAAYVVGVAAKKLRQKNLNVLIVPADGSVMGLKAKAFLAIHADGSVKPCTTGPSLAYPSGASPFAMHAIGLATSRALGNEYNSFKRDNFTANAGHYYMFGRVNTQHLSGLLEIGELTCPASERNVIEGSTRLGQNVAQALEFIVNLQ
jgi:N-acetylmuramoyl-L-alanine amidase